MADLPTITVKQLRDSLAQLGPAWDDTEVQCWLPGARIKIAPTLIPHTGTALGNPPVLLLEGNVVPGSAFDALA